MLLIVLTAACQREDVGSLRSQFIEHQDTYQRLLTMFEEDSRLVRIAPDFTRLVDDRSWPRDDVGISLARWQEYRALFRAAGIPAGVERQDQKVFFYVSGAGLSVSGSTRGFVHAKNPSSKVNPNGEGIVYVPIRGDWYLFEWTF